VSRIYKHKHREFYGFTSTYCIDKLVYFETTSNPVSANCPRKAAQALAPTTEDTAH
jgi:predicted GIY-YIG superfamily endonuclease